MTIKTYISIVALIFAVGAAYGQEDLTRRVDVSKDYAPRVEKAAKLAIQPQLGDTTTLRPDLNYTVRPRAWSGGFSVDPIRAAQMNTGTYNPQYPLYIKVGGGFPGQTIFDLYATTIRPGASGLGFYANHRAQFADIANYYDIKQSAKSTSNSVGIFGKAVFGRQGRLSVAGEVGFDYDVWSDYGVFNYSISDNLATKFDNIPMQHYATPHASITFGNDFTDLSFLNFRLGGDVYRLEDRLDSKETGGRAFAEIGKQFGLHQLVFGAEVYKYSGTANYIDATTDQSNSIVSVNAGYRIVHNMVTFGMGGRFAFESPSGDEAPENKTWFLPQMELKIAAADEFNPYARLNSEIDINSYRNITAANPYIFRRFFEPLPAIASYDLRAGFNGTLGNVFYYNVYAGYGIVKNDIIVTTITHTTFLINSWGHILQTDEKRTSIFAGAEFEAKIGNGFAITASGRYDKYSSDIYDQVNYLPNYTASFGIRYKHQDKWMLRAGVEARGAYEFVTHDIVQISEHDLRWKAPSAVNVTLGVDYSLSERLGVFVEGNNLANQKLYPLPFHRGVGVNVSGGIKLRL